MKSLRINLDLQVFLFVLILVICMVFTGCFRTSGYKAVTVTKSGIRFSFEYPASYHDNDNSFSNKENFVAVNRHKSDTEKKYRNTEGEIQIKLLQGNAQVPDYAAYLESFLEDIPRFVGDFTVLERTLVQVSGIKGEMLVYSGNYSGDLHLPEFISDELKTWEVWLDYKGLIVTIALFSIADIADESEVHFNHLIKSFKFLN